MAKRKQPKQSKPRKPVKRQTRHFQLRVEHPKDAHVKEILDYARTQRREVTLIRDAVALYWALENDNLEVLFEMFPKHRAKLTSGGQGGGGELLEIKSMLEIITAGRKANELVMQSAAAPTSTGQQIAAPIPEIKPAAQVSASDIADAFLAQF